MASSSSSSSSSCSSLMILLVILLQVSSNSIVFLLAEAQSIQSKISAVFTFGDSILDTGNNNNLPTLSRCNFPPYGRDFPGAVPTGRFCNGKVPSDFITSSLGIKEFLPAYLDPNLKSSDLPTGVGFASGGSGSDVQTAIVQRVLTLPNQLYMFKEYIVKLKGVVGEERANSIIENGLFLISSGNNDVAFTYPNLRRSLLIPFTLYADQLVRWSSDFIEQLYGLGARRFAVLSTIPIGCLPAARTIAGGPLRICDIVSNNNAQIFNSKLSSRIDYLKTSLPDAKLVFIDVFTDLLQIIQNPRQNGFIVVTNGCCGTGTVEMGPSCNQLSPSTCKNIDDYVFWDIGHPTQKAYRIISDHIIQKLNASF